MEKTIKNQIAKAAKKAGVSVVRIVGPLPANTTPVAGRKGLYLRVSAETGDIVWAKWNGKNFGLYADTKQRAEARAHKRSKKALPWFGISAA